MLKRIGLFVLTNILVLTAISIIFSVLGVGPYISRSGLDYGNLLVFCLVWGMVGSFISLLLSKQMAKWMMGVKVIDPTQAGEFQELVVMVHELARRAGLPRMPEVGVYQSPELNAFATGPSKSNSLVAISSGLLHSMTREQLEGVIGHELAHIKNGDMVTMTLIQGVVNAFTMFISRALAYAISRNMRDENRYLVRSLLIIVLQIIIGWLGYMLVCWFSRQREFRADRGSAEITGDRREMIAALRALGQRSGQIAAQGADAFATMKIAGKPGRFFSLFVTHPPLDDRIRALEAAP